MTFEQKVEQVLEQSVRPLLHSHGGEVRLIQCQDGCVTVELMGACSGCPSADLSTRGFIEDTLRSELPEVTSVVLFHTVSSELLEAARQLLSGGGE